jgi:dephospho-CoA kinase
VPRKSLLPRKRLPPRATPPPSLATSSSSRPPVALAITGGIGAGKTETLRAFARHGAAVISSDEIVHELLRSDSEVKEAVVARLGEETLGPDGEIDRRKVAEIVFADRGALVWLEELLHPRVVARYLGWREELATLPRPPAVCVTEVPLLYEVGGESRFDKVLVVTASPEARISRRIGPLREREQRLLPDAEKAKRADYVYVNDGSLEELDAFVSGVMRTLSA